MITTAAQAFREFFQADPTGAGVAPGRVEVLGNHTDYNGGAVLAAAIDRVVVVSGRRSTLAVSRVHSLAFNQRVEFARGAADRVGIDWADLMCGSLRGLTRAGIDVPPFDAVVVGDIPVAAGLSSSAALTVATAMFVRHLVGPPQEAGHSGPGGMTLLELARVMQEAEHLGLGVRCGLLDPFTSLHGQRGALVLFDGAAQTGRTVALANAMRGQPALVVVNSNVRRTLAASAYNTRRRECEAAAERLQRELGRPVPQLCGVTLDEFRAVESRLDDVLRRRARHVIREHVRVLHAVAALERGDIEQLGALLRASHASSQKDFENSTARLDLICRVADRHPACLGSRLCGAGWGGCTIHLVRPEGAQDFSAAVARAVERESGFPVAVYRTEAADGAAVIDLSTKNATGQA